MSTSAENAVLMAYFKTLGVPRHPILLATSTQSVHLDIDIINLQLAANGRAISAEAREDFKSANKAICKLGISRLPNVRIVSAPEDDTLGAVPERFGKSACLVRASRVGFNRGNTVAILHVSTYCQSSGYGYLYVFERKAGQWVKTIESPTWTT